MNKKIYLVKKNRNAQGSNTEWIQMNGREFYNFLHSEAGKGRYFIRLTDDISYDEPEIIIEATPELFFKWRREYDRHRYLV